MILQSMPRTIISSSSAAYDSVYCGLSITDYSCMPQKEFLLAVKLASGKDKIHFKLDLDSKYFSYDLIWDAPF